MSEISLDMWDAARRIDDALRGLSKDEQRKAIQMAIVSAGVEYDLDHLSLNQTRHKLDLSDVLGTIDKDNLLRGN